MSSIFEKLSPALKSAGQTASGNIRLPAVRMMYASLFVPTPPSRQEKDPKKKQWSITGLVPGICDLAALEEEIDRIVADNLTEAKRKPLPNGELPYKRPILKTASIASLADYAEEYPYTLRMNTKEFTRDGKRRPAPQVIDAKGAEVKEEQDADDVYNGRWFRASINPFWYGGENGKPGISLGLVNVQLLYHDDPLAGGRPKASSEFEAVEDALEDGIGEVYE